MMLEDGLLGALCLGGGGWEDGWRTICLDTVAGGLDGDCIDTVGSSREERDGLVDGTGIATVGLDAVAGLDSIGLDSIDLDSVGSSREEGAGLVWGFGGCSWRVGLLLFGSIAFWHGIDGFLGARRSFNATQFNTLLVIYVVQLFASLYLFCDERGVSGG
jgi:hypothetical protein